MLADVQRGLAAFILGGDAAVAGRLRDSVPPARLAVHRNNALGSLGEVLGQAYPLVRRSLGEDAFMPLARSFAAHMPPPRPLLWSYGDGFADWLETALPDGAAPWLSDLARLDRAMQEALFAADAEALDPARLALVPPERIDSLRLVAHPSVRLVRSRWPLHLLWKNLQAGAAGPVESIPEAVLTGRPAEEVLCIRLSAADGALAEILLSGGSLGAAAGSAGEGADLQGVLALLLRNRLLVGFAVDGGFGKGEEA